jgi:hypothetical protein
VQHDSVILLITVTLNVNRHVAPLQKPRNEVDKDGPSGTVTENGETIFGLEALLKETCSLPGLNSTHFALPPRWVRPVEHISSPYSSITFAFSDPDGSITAKLLKGRHRLFGKEVHLEKWLDKPPLVQCSCCHKLGHTAASRSCLVPKGDIKCACCAGHHTTDNHAHFCKG